jgi:hypothetical protein
MAVGLSRIFLAGRPPPENFEKLDALRGVFPPSQKLKGIPTKKNGGRFCRKTLRSDKKAI